MAWPLTIQQSSNCQLVKHRVADPDVDYLDLDPTSEKTQDPDQT